MERRQRQHARRNRGRIRRLLRRVFLCLGPLVLFFSLFNVALPQLVQVGFGYQLTTGEFELKAVYLYNFLHFVNWPDKADEMGRDNSFVIGVIGVSPIVEALEEVRKGLAGSGRRNITIINHGPYRPDEDLECCHILYISDSESGNFSKILSAVKGKPVITVSDHIDFLAAGGMIHLVKHEGRVRWEINRRAIRSSGLRFSAKLMDIAVTIVE